MPMSRFRQVRPMTLRGGFAHLSRAAAAVAAVQPEGAPTNRHDDIP